MGITDTPPSPSSPTKPKCLSEAKDLLASRMKEMRNSDSSLPQLHTSSPLLFLPFLPSFYPLYYSLHFSADLSPPSFLLSALLFFLLSSSFLLSFLLSTCFTHLAVGTQIWPEPRCTHEPCQPAESEGKGTET